MTVPPEDEVVPDSPLWGGQPRTQVQPQSRFDSPGIDAPAPPLGGLKPRPELDPVIQRRQLFSLTRLPFVDTTPEEVQGVVRELEVGRLEKPADFWAKCKGDAYVARCHWTRCAAVANRPISVEPNPGAPKWKRVTAQENADFANMMLARLQASGAMEEAVLRQMSATIFGLAIERVDWHMADGWWLPEQFVPVLTRDIRLDLDWTPTVRDEIFRYHRVAEHPGKFWVFRPQTMNGILADQGVFRGVAWLSFFKSLLMRFRMFSAERFGTPLIIAYVEQLLDQAGKVNAATRTGILDYLKSMTVDSVAVVPNGSKIEVISPQGTGSAEIYDTAIKSINEEIQVLMLGMTTMFTPGANGSRSAEETRNGVRLESTAQDSRLVLGSFVSGPLAWAIAYNGLDPDPSCLPHMATVFADDTKPVDAVALSARVVKNNEYRKALGLPPIDGPWGEQFAQAAPQYGSAPTTPDAPGGAPAGSPFKQPRSGPLGGMPDLSDPRTR